MLPNNFRFWFGLFFVALMALPLARPAIAANNCEAFGASSVAFAQANVANNCGFTGGAWANDFQGHTNWCKQPSVSDAQIAQILADRQNMINQCQSGRTGACHNYANSAVLKAREAARLGCGYENNSAYDDNYQGHFDWCLVNPDATVVAANNATNIGIDQCREAKLGGICSFYTTAIAPLFQRENEACAGRADFAMSAPSPQDRADCLANTGLDAAWVNQQVTERNARIQTCESNTVTYSNLGHRGAPLDVCTNDLGAFCDGWVPDQFCRWQGHASSTGDNRFTTDFTVHLDCVMTGNVNAAAEQGECFCSGTCGGMTEITCTGRN